MIIMEKSDYLQKVESDIMGNVYLEVEKDPTEKYQKILKAVMQGCDKENGKTCEMYPTASKLQGLIKFYEENRPIRSL